LQTHVVELLAKNGARSVHQRRPFEAEAHPLYLG
jgi:hypothetical protein